MGDEREERVRERMRLLEQGHTISKPWFVDWPRAMSSVHPQMTYEIKAWADVSVSALKPALPGPDARPTRGYIQYTAGVRDGERWPTVRYQVRGYHPTQEGDPRCHRMALLMRDGGWRWFEDRGDAFRIPDECLLSQTELGDALGAAGCGEGLPLVSPDVGACWKSITYVDTTPRPAQALREDFKPRSPKWRGGKPWR